MKRFTETTKWRDTWFADLPSKYKLGWLWTLDNCDAAGVVEPNVRAMAFDIGEPIQAEEFLRHMAGRVTRLGTGKWFVPKFVAYQYGKLSRDCRPHLPVFSALEKHGIDLQLVNAENPDDEIKRVSIPYPKGIHTLKEKEKEKDKGKDLSLEMSEPVRDKPARQRDAILDALATVGGGSPEEVTNWKPAVAAKAQIVAVSPGVTAEEIKRRAANYRTHFEGAALTPTALAKHWPACSEARSGRSGNNRIATTTEEEYRNGF